MATATPNDTKLSKRHFHTFDALRFFACFKVFLQHLPIFAFPVFAYLKRGGGIGVHFFFVLSGFLITYIICEEKQQTGKLNLKNFFARRVLRIWPLFYLMIGVAYITPFILNHFLHLNNSDVGYDPDWRMSLLFLENYKMMATHDNPNISPLAVMWSLCVEEHFYIVWGLLFYFTSIKRIPVIIGCSIALGVVMRIVYVYYNIPTSDILTNIDLFAFGAIPAYLLIVAPVRTELFINSIKLPVKWMFVVVLLLVVTLCSQAKGDGQYIFITSLLGAMFSILIMLTLPQNTRFRISDSNIVSKLGIYTYGFYLYHTLIINLFRRLFEKAELTLDNAGWAIAFTLITLALSLLASVASYHLFEKHFLKLKKYFRK